MSSDSGPSADGRKVHLLPARRARCDLLPRIHAIVKLARQMETSDAAKPVYRGAEPRHKGFVAGDPKGTLWSRVSEIARNAAPDARPGPV
jgi:hypothetical protein